MRATGFGIRSPKDATGDYLYPQMSKDGVCLDMSHKTITEQRRELMYLHKLSARSNGGQDFNRKAAFRGSLETIKDEIETARSPVAEAAVNSTSGDFMAKVHQIQKQRPFSSNNYAPALSR